MTKDDAIMLLKYALVNYPAVKIQGESFMQTAAIWYNEFIDCTKEQVIAGFKEARMKSPDWMPSIAQIRASMICIEQRELMERKLKTQDDLFRDSHCGKSREEWESMRRWELSSDGSKKVSAYKQRLLELLGG